MEQILTSSRWTFSVLLVAYSISLHSLQWNHRYEDQGPGYQNCFTKNIYSSWEATEWGISVILSEE